MKDFIEHINPRLREFDKYELSRSHEYQVRDQVIKHFKLKDINQLRDKFEGVAFLEKTYKKAIALWITSKIFDTELIKLDDFEPHSLKLNFSLKNKYWEIVIFDYGDVPKIKMNDKTNYVLILKRNLYCFYFCGLLLVENNLELYKIYNNTEFKFIDFDVLSK